MAYSKGNASLALFLSLNLLFFGLTANAWTPPAKPATCPRDALKLGICADLLGSLLGIVIGNPPKLPCCSLIEGLLDLEAAVCLCTAIKANLLGIHLDIPLSISLLLNACGKTYPSDFQCS